MDLFLGFMVIYIDPILLALFFANSVALLKKLKIMSVPYLTLL